MELDREVIRVARLGSWSEADAKLVVSVWRRSGESRAEFGRRYGIPVHRLYYWVGQLGSQAERKKSAQAVGFHPVEVTRSEEGQATAMEIRLIRVPRGFSPEELSAVLAALG